MDRKKVFITGNGCERRGLDCSRLAEYFRANGWGIVRDPRRADHIVFVTCSFKETREEECWRYIEEFRSCGGELIVLGCLPEIAPVKFVQRFKGRHVSTKDLDGIDRIFSDFKIKFKDIPSAHHLPGAPDPKLSLSGLWKSFFVEEEAFLRICDGCVERCAYCCIYRAVGKLRSKTIPACVEEYRDILRRGHRKIVITADNIGSYGLDINNSFGELLNSLSAASDKQKVHWLLRDLHPKWAILYKAELLERAEDKKIGELSCPVQSGSNRILKLMNRHHGIEEVRGLLLELKKVNPDLKLCTDIIIGFPSETEEDLLATLNVIKEIRFDLVCLYPYYDGYDTIASRMEGKIDGDTIRRRMGGAVAFLRRGGIAFHCDP